MNKNKYFSSREWELEGEKGELICFGANYLIIKQE
jgi:hypothetical protein